MASKIDEDIRSGNFERVYLLYGEEEYLVEFNKKKLMRAILPEGDDLNLNVWQGKELDVSQLIGQAQTMPFFAERRLIVVEDSGLFKKNADVLAEALVTFPAETVIIFTEKEKPDARGKLFKTIKSIGYTQEYAYLKDADLERWVVRSLDRAGKKIQISAVRLFMERAGDDMRSISSEINKLIDYTYGREAIYLEDVQKITTVHMESRIFEMTDAIANKNVRRALERYEEMLALKESPLGILAMLYRQFERLLQVKELRDRGLDQATIEERLQMKSFVVRKALGQISNFTFEELRELLEHLAQADSDIKSGKMQDVLAVELLIIEAASS